MEILSKIRKYGLWGEVLKLICRRYEKIRHYGLRRSDRALSEEKKAPQDVLISILTPLYRTDPLFLSEMIRSVQAQTYGSWELCLVDFSPAGYDAAEQTARSFAAGDRRILFRRAEKNRGIAENTSLCAAMAHGSYLAILDHDDVLDPSALFEVMQAVREGADFIYTDEIKFEGTIGNLFSPFYKPDYTEEELHALNYICHLNVYSRALYERAGGYRAGFDGSQDHDFVLRATACATHIVHIPQILYYWRVHQNSVASGIGAKPYAVASGVRAVNAALARKGRDYTVRSVDGVQTVYRLNPATHPAARFAVLVWNCAEDEGKQAARESLGAFAAGAEAVSSCSGVPRMRDITALAARTGCPYVLVLLAGVRISPEGEGPAGLAALLSSGSAAAADGEIHTDRDRIWSAGIYVRPSHHRIGRRAAGRPLDFPGDGCALQHVRGVSGVSGVLSMVRVSAVRSEDRDCTVQAWSLLQHRIGGHCVISPFVSGVGSSRALGAAEHVLGQTEAPEGEDPYFRSELLRQHLE